MFIPRSQHTHAHTHTITMVTMWGERYVRLTVAIISQWIHISKHHIVRLNYIRFFVFLFCLFRAAPAAHGGSQARGLIGPVVPAYTTATATPDPSHIFNLHHSSWQRWSLIYWARPGIEPATSWLLVWFVNPWATTGTPTIYNLCQLYLNKAGQKEKSFK